MKLLILTEGGSKSGFGHLTRTSAIAAEVRRLSPRSEIKFYISGDTRAQKYIKTLGNDAQVLDWIKTPDVLKEIKSADAVITDSYKAPLALCKKIAALNPACFWLDDYGRLPYPAGTVIVPGPYAMPGKDSLPAGVKLFSGKEFIILRGAFKKTVNKFKVRKKIQNVLILLGGTGTAENTKKIMTSLQAENKNLKFTWVAPGGAVCSPVSNLKVLKNISAEKLIEAMIKSDLAVSSAGQTLYELASVGLPVISVQIADNQRQNVLALKKTGYLQDAGLGFNALTLKNMKVIFKKLKSTELRSRLSRKGIQSVNRGGAERIASLLIKGKS